MCMCVRAHACVRTFRGGVGGGCGVQVCVSEPMRARTYTHMRAQTHAHAHTHGIGKKTTNYSHMYAKKCMHTASHFPYNFLSGLADTQLSKDDLLFGLSSVTCSFSKFTRLIANTLCCMQTTYSCTCCDERTHVTKPC